MNLLRERLLIYIFIQIDFFKKNSKNSNIALREENRQSLTKIENLEESIRSVKDQIEPLTSDFFFFENKKKIEKYINKMK